MRRWPTWLLVGALAALGVVAVADALRGSAEIRAEPATAPADQPVRQPRLREPRGILYYSDPEDGCRLQGVALPGLENAPPPDFASCEFSLSPDGTAVLPDTVSWSPRGGLYARDPDGMIELGSPASDERLMFPGRAPAFMPDGTFTYVNGRNEVVAWTTDCPAGARLFTLPADNATARCSVRVARLPNPASRLAWLTDERLAAVVHRPKGGSELLFVQGTEFHPVLVSAKRNLPLDASPRGTYIATNRQGRLVVFHRDGWPVPLPRLGSLQAIAWSPDERRTAVATDSSVFVFPTDEPGAAVRRLPIRARDLDWR